MSSKINVRGIISGHINTLKDASTSKQSFIDIAVFFLMPFLIALGFAFFKVSLSKEIASLLVNFGSIFTALLLSVLVLVYDQSNKLKEKDSHDILIKTRMSLLNELYYNICYAIIISIMLVLACLVHTILFDKTSTFDIPKTTYQINMNYGLYIFGPIIIFLTSNVILTIVMIVKRMHTLLTT